MIKDNIKDITKFLVSVSICDTDVVINEKKSRLIRNLGNLIMSSIEPWNSINLLQNKIGYIIEFQFQEDAILFSKSLLEKINNSKNIDVLLLIHEDINIDNINIELYDILKHCLPNRINVSDIIEESTIKKCGFKLTKNSVIAFDHRNAPMTIFCLEISSNKRNNLLKFYNRISEITNYWRYYLFIIFFSIIIIYFFGFNNKSAPSVLVWMVDSSDKSLDKYLTWGITEDIYDILKKSNDIEIVPYKEMVLAYSSNNIPEDVAKSFGVNYIFISDLVKTESSVELNYSLNKIEKNKNRYKKRKNISIKKIPQIADIFSKYISNSLNLDYYGNASSNKIPLESYKSYVKGKYFIKHAKSSKDVDRGIKLLEESIKLDPKFYLAQEELAHIYFDNGKLTKAKNLFKLAMEEASKARDKQKTFENLKYLADVFFEIGDYNNASQCYKKTLILSDNLGHKNLIPEISRNLGLIFNQIGYTDSSEYYFKKSIKVSHSLNDSLKAIPEILLLSDLYYKEKNYYKAIKHFKTALNYSILSRDSTAMSSALHHISEIYWIKMDFTESIRYQLELLNIKEKSANKIDLNWIYFRLGSLYENQCEFQNAEKYFLKALNLRKDIGSKRDIAEVFSYLGLVKLNTKKYNKAYYYFNEAKNIYQILRDRSGLGFMSHNLGEASFHSGKLSESESFFRKAVTIWRELDNPSMEIWSLSWLVLSEMKSGNRESEVDLYILNKILKQNEISSQDRPIVYYNLHLIYKNKNIEEESISYLKKSYTEILKISENIQNEYDRINFLEKKPLNIEIIKSINELK